MTSQTVTGAVTE